MVSVDFDKKTKALRDLLQGLMSSVPEIEAVAVVSIEGLPISAILPEGIEETRLAAMTAAMLSLGERVAQEMSRGILQKIFIEGESGFIFSISAGVNAVLTASAHKGAKLGLIFLDMNRCAQDVSAVLQ